jgi:hypothetical protein
MRFSFAVFMAISALAALSACGGGLKGAVNNEICSFSTPLPSAIPQMMYPMPGAVQVPVTAPAMVVGFTGTPSIAGTISLQASDGTTVALGPMGAAPRVMPTPFAPLQAGTAYGVTLPTLSKHTGYAVTYKYLTRVSACGGANTATVPIGAFATL